MIQVLTLTYLLHHLWFQPSVFLPVAGLMQPRSILIFLFLHPPVISAKSLAAGFGFSFSRVVCNLAEIIEEILAEIRKSQLQSAGFDSLKIWAGPGKGEKGVKQCLSDKIEQRASKQAKEIFKYWEVLIHCMKLWRPHSPRQRQHNSMDIDGPKALLIHKRHL